jgi:hypothetical protein
MLILLGSLVAVASATQVVPPLDKTLTFYSQQGEDLVILSELFTAADGQVLTGGVFLEVGGLDGIKFSNTLALDRHLGWSGVLIEGCPENYEQMVINRPSAINVGKAVCKSGVKSVEFAGHCGAISGIADSLPSWAPNKNVVRQVPCATMTDILETSHSEAISCVDFMSIDVEGFELHLLRTLDFAKIKVRSILIEMEHSQDRAEIRQILLTAGFESRGFVGIFLGDELFTKIGDFRNKTDPSQEACRGKLSDVSWPPTWPAAEKVAKANGKICTPHHINGFFRARHGGAIHPDVAASIKLRDDTNITHGALPYYNDSVTAHGSNDRLAAPHVILCGNVTAPPRPANWVPRRRGRRPKGQKFHSTILPPPPPPPVFCVQLQSPSCLFSAADTAHATCHSGS